MFVLDQLLFVGALPLVRGDYMFPERISIRISHVPGNRSNSEAATSPPTPLQAKETVGKVSFGLLLLTKYDI